MKRAIFFVLCMFIIASYTAHADDNISIRLLGVPSNDDIRFLYLESLQSDSGAAKYSISYHDATVSTNNLALLSSGDYDIVLLYHKALTESVQQGFILPLNDITNETRFNWIPVSTLLECNGTAYGLPFCYFANLLSLDEATAQRVHFQLPSSPYSWDDLLHACNSSSMGQSDETCLLYTNVELPFFLMQYMSEQFDSTGNIQFDTPTLRATLKAYADMVRNGYIIDYEADQKAEPILTVTAYPTNFVPFPDIGDESCFVVDLYALCVPQGAPNPQEALMFLSDYASAKCQGQVALGNWNQMVCQSLEIYAQGLIDYFPFYSEELRQQVTSRGVPRFPNSEFIQYLNETRIITSYVDQDITLDKLLLELQNTWEHILAEQG